MSGDAVSEPRSPAEGGVIGGFRSYFNDSGILYWTTCLSCQDVDPGLERAGALVAVLLCGDDGLGRPVFPKIVVAVAPDDALDDPTSVLMARIDDHALAERGTELTEIEKAAIARRLAVVSMKDLHAEGLLRLIEAVPRHSAVVATDVAAYRCEGIGPIVAPGATGPNLAEDFWVPHLVEVARQGTAMARAAEVFLVLEAGTTKPLRADLVELLARIDDDCGVILSSLVNDPMEIVAVNVERWLDLLGKGRLGIVLGEIDAVPRLTEHDKLLVRAQCLHLSGLSGQALEMIEKLLLLPGRPAALSAIRLARIAADAGAAPLAARLLKPAIGDNLSREELEAALAVSGDVGDEGLADVLVARLIRLHGDTPALRRRRLVGHVARRDYASAARASDAADVAFYEALAESFAVEGIPDYSALLSKMRSGSALLGDRARIECIRDALARRLPLHARQLAPRHDTQGWSSKTALKLLERMLLDRDGEGALVVSYDALQNDVIDLVRFLSGRPYDGWTRTRLSKILSPDVAGNLGLPIIASVALAFGKRPIEVIPLREPSRADAIWLDEKADLFRAVFAWFDAEGQTVMGRVVMPEDLIVESADDMIAALIDYIQTRASMLGDDVDELIKLTAVAISIAPHTSDRDQDLELMRFLAGRFAAAGRVQSARDFCQQILLNAGPNRMRARAAWYALADVYHRTGDLLEATLAMACAMAIEGPCDERRAWLETTGLVRILRDSGLTTLALSVLATARTNFRDFAFAEANAHRLDTLELQLEQIALDDNPAALPNSLPGLLGRAIDLGRRVATLHDDVAPVAVMIGELARKAKTSGISVPADAAPVIEALVRRGGPSVAPLVRAASAIHPAAADVVGQVRRQDAARYAEDVGFGNRAAVLLARRMLSGQAALADSDTAAYAVELLADRGTALPGWETVTAPAGAAKDLAVPARTARALSAAGPAIFLLGFDDAGRLVSLVAEGGVLSAPIRSGSDGITLERLTKWCRDFPYGYAVDAPNLFLNSTEGFVLEGLPEVATMIIADIRLQAYPPQLLRIGDEFAGSLLPLAAAPSLAWLGAARRAGNRRDGRELAWISRAEGSTTTLASVVDWLGAVFIEHSIPLTTSASIPTGFENADLVTVVAHGQVVPEGSYFQTIADDAALKVAAASLAIALRNVGVVILFVCSGGRVDRHPAADTTLGLAKALLNRGCSAVVAAPWPIDPRIAVHWLPAFFTAWEAGEMLIDANFRANQVVAEAFPFDTAKTVAMGVYGDAAVRRRRS